jgi:hypothetical protein
MLSIYRCVMHLLEYVYVCMYVFANKICPIVIWHRVLGTCSDSTGVCKIIAQRATVSNGFFQRCRLLLVVNVKKSTLGANMRHCTVMKQSLDEKFFCIRQYQVLSMLRRKTSIAGQKERKGSAHRVTVTDSAAYASYKMKANM